MNPKRRVLRLAARQHALVTRRQALDAGMSRHEIDSMVAAREFEVVHRGVYRVAGSPQTWAQTVMAASLAAGPEAVASHRSAAALLGMPVGANPPVELTVPARLRPRVRGAIIHRAGLAKGDRAQAQGIPVTAPARTLVDIAGVVDRSVLEDVLDDSAERKLVNLTRLDAYLERLGRQGRGGAGALHDLLSARLRVARVQQGRFEREVLALVKRYGLPAPVFQHKVCLPNGDEVYLDIAWPPFLVALEADSYRYHSSLSSWSADRTRNNEIVAALGYRLLSITWLDVKRRPAASAAMLAKALDVSPALAG